MADPSEVFSVNRARKATVSHERHHKIDVANEVKRLQRDNTALDERVKRRDDRIRDLDKKIARLRKEVSNYRSLKLA